MDTSTLRRMLKETETVVAVLAIPNASPFITAIINAPDSAIWAVVFNLFSSVSPTSSVFYDVSTIWNSFEISSLLLAAFLTSLTLQWLFLPSFPAPTPQKILFLIISRGSWEGREAYVCSIHLLILEAQLSLYLLIKIIYWWECTSCLIRQK